MTLASRAGAAPALAFAACCAIWGTTFLVIQRSNDALAPVWGAALRLALAGAILAIVWAFVRSPMPRGRALYAVLAFGLLDFGINLGFLYWGERSVPSGLAAVFYATAPITTLFLARFFGQERLDAWRVGATLVAFVGVVIVFASQLRASANVWALVAILAAATVTALSGVVLRMVPPQPLLPTVTLGCLASATLLVPVSLLMGETLAMPGSWDAWWPVLYLAGLGSIVAFGLYTWLLGRWSASNATLAGVIVPVIAVAIGALVAQERLPLSTLAGAALVLVGTLAALLRGRATAAAREAGPVES